MWSLRFWVIVVDLDPVTIRIPEIDLLDAVNTGGDCIGHARPAFVSDIVFPEPRDHIFYRRHTEAEVAILIVRNYGVGALYKMEMTGRSNSEPSVFTIVKRFRDGVEHDYFLIKTCAHCEVFNIYSYVVQDGFDRLGMAFLGKKSGENNNWYQTLPTFHTTR